MSIRATARQDQALLPYFYVHPKVLSLLPKVLPPRHHTRSDVRVAKSVFIPPHPWGWMWLKPSRHQNPVLCWLF